MWMVIRDGGTWHPPRYLPFDAEADARREFEKMREAMRQGSVELRYDGKRVDYSWAPRLRSRW